MKKKKEYALYKGDDFIDIGTKEYLAHLINVKPKTIQYLGSNAYKKKYDFNMKNKMVAVRLDDEI